MRATKLVMGFDPDAHFQVEQGVYEHMSLGARGAALQAEAERREAAWKERYPQLLEDWELAWSGRLREGWQDALPEFEAGAQIATRTAGQKTMAAFGPFAPTMVGGAADLVESTKTLFDGAGEYSKVHVGRNIPFGIREHAMGAIVNGLGAHGGMVKPYGSTFLVFSDYMRAPVRLSALMELPVMWVWTHDSIGLGEDGPTHQPVEHYAALRAIPHLWVMRPADAAETAQAWRLGLEREDGPVALLLSRQNLPVLDRAEVGSVEGVRKGGYVLWDSSGTPHDGAHPEGHKQAGGGATGDGASAGVATPWVVGEGGSSGVPDLVLIATGSEVAPSLTAARALAAEGAAVRVVSMPCMELFEAQAEDYRESVIPREVPARLAVEAGVTQCWWKWVGDRGEVLGIDRFGASAPGTSVLERLGFTADSIAARGRALLKGIG